MKGSSGGGGIHAFKRSLESASGQHGQRKQHQQDGVRARPGGERRRILFHKARKAKNGFVSLSTATSVPSMGGAGQSLKVGVHGAC